MSDIEVIVSEAEKLLKLPGVQMVLICVFYLVALSLFYKIGANLGKALFFFLQ